MIECNIIYYIVGIIVGTILAKFWDSEMFNSFVKKIEFGIYDISENGIKFVPFKKK